MRDIFSQVNKHLNLIAVYVRIFQILTHMSFRSNYLLYMLYHTFMYVVVKLNDTGLTT